MAKSKKNTPKPFIIDEETLHDAKVKDQVFYPTIDGERKGHGYEARDYRVYPEEMFDPPNDMPKVPKSEWSDRLKALKAGQGLLSDIRLTGDNGKPIPSLDQNGQGYCWAYSTGSVLTVIRALNHQPYVRLSPHAVACIIKNYQNQGGWCGLSAKFVRERGMPTIRTWPEKSMSRSNDKPEVWTEAEKNKTTEDWCDLTRAVYDQNLTFEQLASCLLRGIPCMVDFNWWAHSVCALDLVEVEAGSFGIYIWNSWTDSWGTQGMGILRGSQAIPNGAVALRVTGAMDN